MSSAVSALFPVPHGDIATGFTTASLTLSGIARTPLTDHALGVQKVSSQATRAVTPAPDRPSSQAWKAIFPKGSINPGNKTAPTGGFGLYLRGPPAFSSALREAREVVFSYEVLFEEGWAWGLGGKLPGIYGGVGDSAYGCTGGRQSDRCKCFDLRLMWREGGGGELYAYLPQVASNTAHLLAVPPRSIQHPDYGFSVGRGAWHFTPGKWTTVAQRVKLNELGKEDGEIEIFIDGRSVLAVSGVVLRTKEGPEAHVQGLHVQTFFGGHTTEWASPRDQHAWFANVSGAVIRTTGQPASKHDEL
ncbi:hypothetical protein B0H21DRAFT_752716 [Amylocystis lapponica]|nr:hypothetical protein B0H21DRAFT_752716 [Amylocystis lapponica]